MSKQSLKRIREKKKELAHRMVMLDWMIESAETFRPQWTDSTQMEWIKSVRDELEVEVDAYTRFLVREGL